MNHFSRRDFVFLSSGAALGNFAAPGLARADEDATASKLDFSQSGLVTGQPKPLKHKEIPGFLFHRLGQGSRRLGHARQAPRERQAVQRRQR